MQIKGLLPKLDGTNFVVSPSLHQLADLARSGGASELGQVQNFMVEHKTWGSVRWLEPVDVRSLMLKDLVQISRSNIAVSALLFVQANQLDSYLDLQPICDCMAPAPAVGMLFMCLMKLVCWTPACTFVVPALVVSHSCACLVIKYEIFSALELSKYYCFY